MSTYTSSLGLELITPGSQAGLWGSTTNNTFTLIDQAVTGVTPVSFASASGSTYVLTDYNGAEDEARSAVLNITGSALGSNTIVIPNKQKTYLVRNNTGKDVVFQTAVPTATYTVGAGYSILIFCDGNNNVFTGIAAPSVGTLLVNAGGTGSTTFTAGFVKSPGGTSALTSSATVDLASEVSGTLPVARGGTGVTSLTAGAVVLGNGTGGLTTVTSSTNGYVLTWNSGTSSWAPAAPAASGVTSISGTSPITVTGTTTPTISLTTVPITLGGTGATSASAALTNLGAVSTSGSYANPSWITSLDYSKITSLSTNYVSIAGAQTISGSKSFSSGADLTIQSGARLIISSGGSVQSQSFNFTSTSSWYLSGSEITGAVSSSVVVKMTSAGGYNLTGVWGTISDRNQKENIQPARNYLSDINQVNIVKYSLKEENSTEATKLGVIAQEVEQVFPTLVHVLEDGTKSVKMSIFIPMLIKSVQELTAKLESAEERIAALEAK